MLADARKSAPPGIEIVPVYDQGLLVRTAIANVRDAILIGGFFSVLILLVFLKSVRATLLAALSIPLSLIISFVFLRLTGDTLNLMSLGGLAVAIGLIIDDSVVVVENIARHLAEGQTGDEAIDRASREISGAVIGSTLTTILVFVPLAFVRGVVGQFFQSLSLALVDCPVGVDGRQPDVDPRAGRPLSWPGAACRPPARSIAVLADGYEGLLRLGLRVPADDGRSWRCWPSCPAGGCSHHLETGFMPEMDEGAFILDYWMPVGTSLSETDEVLAARGAVLGTDRPTSAATSAAPGRRTGLLRHRGVPRRHPGRA